MINKYKKALKIPKLASVILEFLIISFIISAFTFVFLYFMSVSLGDIYFISENISIKSYQRLTFITWVRSICFFALTIVFVSLFLFMFGQKISYLISIIKGVEALQENEMDFIIQLEGNDELTQLAQTINYLSKSQIDIKRKEKELKEEREEIIRSLSHDIRTPLTSIISYSDYIKNKENLTKEEIQNYILLIESKSQQIKILTDYLLGKENKEPELIENGKLLMEQLVYEWEEFLEDMFQCEINLQQCENFKCNFKIEDLHRIFDNIASNIQKYAEQTKPIEINILTKENKLFIIQKNFISKNIDTKIESHNIGLNSINNIVKRYKGEVNILKENDIFEISIVFPIDF